MIRRRRNRRRNMPQPIEPRARWTLIAALALAAPLFAGCRAAVYQELLEAQNRQLESRLRELEWENEDLQSELERCQSGSGSKAGKSSGRKSSSADSSEKSSGSRRRNATKRDDGPPKMEDLEEPLVEEGSDSEEESTDAPRAKKKSGQAAPPSQGPPKLQAPDPDVPEGRTSGPANRDRSDSSGQDSDDSDAQQGDDANAEAELPAESDDKADAEHAAPINGAFEIGLIPQGTRLVAATNRQTGGFTLLVEPRDQNGQAVKSIGDVAIVAVDPSKEGVMARLARWDFTAEAAALHFKKTPAGEGLHFELAWPDKPPATDAFDVYVRLTTEDGRKLVARHTLTGQASRPDNRRWSRANPAPKHAHPPRTRTGPARREGEPTPADLGDDAPSRR